MHFAMQNLMRFLYLLSYVGKVIYITYIHVTYKAITGLPYTGYCGSPTVGRNILLYTIGPFNRGFHLQHIFIGE